MDLLQCAQERRQHLLAEIEDLDWFLRVADYLLSEGDAHSGLADQFAIQFGPIMKVEKADFRRTMIETFRHSHRAAS